MSLLIKALDRPSAQGQSRLSGYNPLQRGLRRSGILWWLMTAVALLIALSIIGWPHWRATTVLNLPDQAQAEPAPAHSSAAPSMTVTPEAPAEREQPTAALAPDPDASDSGIRQPEPSPPQEPAISAGSPPAENSNTTTEVSGVAVAAAVVDQPATATRSSGSPPSAPAPPPSVSTAAEDISVTADNSPERRQPGPENEEPLVAINAASSSVAQAVPRDTEVRQAVQTAVAQSDLGQARRLLQAWINREPRLEEPRIWLAKVYLNQGGQADAESLLVGLQSIEALGLRGLILEQTERYSDAARVFEALARQEAGNPQWWLHWAINLENSGRLAEARLLYQTYLEQFSGHNARLTEFATERYRALAG